MRPPLVLLASLIACIAICSVAIPDASAMRRAPTDDETIEAMVGTWRLASRSNAIEARDTGIDRVVGEMNILVRRIARRRLRRGLTPHGQITIARAGDKLRFAVGAYSVTAAPGEAVAFTDPEGNTGRMRVALRSGRLSQRFSLEDSSVLTHTISVTRRGLRLTTRVAHDRLPADVRFSALYSKQ